MKSGLLFQNDWLTYILHSIYHLWETGECFSICVNFLFCVEKISSTSSMVPLALSPVPPSDLHWSTTTVVPVTVVSSTEATATATHYHNHHQHHHPHHQHHCYYCHFCLYDCCHVLCHYTVAVIVYTEWSRLVNPGGTNVHISYALRQDTSLTASLHPSVSAKTFLSTWQIARRFYPCQSGPVWNVFRIAITCLTQSFLLSSLPSLFISFFFFSYSSFFFSSFPFPFSWFPSLAKPSLV